MLKSNTAENNPTMASEEEIVLDLNKMKIADLKKELQLRGLKVSGNKQDLIQRLQQYLEEHEGAEVEEDDDELLDEEEEEDAETETNTKTENEDEKPKVSDDKNDEKQVDMAPEAKADIKTAAKLTDEERRAARATKFGLKVNELSDAERLANRSKRFGLNTSDASPDTDKLKSRAERFGVVVSDVLSKTDEEERKRKRVERFGGLKSDVDDGSLSEKKKRRAERFGIPVV